MNMLLLGSVFCSQTSGFVWVWVFFVVFVFCFFFLIQVVFQNVYPVFGSVFGNNPCYLSPTAAAFAGSNETGNELGECVGGSPIPTASGKGLWKSSCKAHYDGLCCSEEKDVAF